MVGGSVAARRKTTGFGAWDGTDYVSVLPGRSRSRRRTDMPQEHFTVSNEVALVGDIHTGSSWRDLAPERAFQGLVENISEGDTLTDPQETTDVAEKKLVASKHVRSYRRNKKLVEAVDRLNRFASSLGTAEAPMHISLAKKALADSWQSIAEEDSGIRITIASLEGALRQRKWRDYTSEQVNVITEILTDCVEGRLGDMKSALKRLSILHKKADSPSVFVEYRYSKGSTMVM